MTTILEKAVIAAGDVAATMDADVRHVLTEAAIERVVRAVLMAVRTADDAALDAGCNVGPDTNNGPFSHDDADAVFTAMIDRILAEPNQG